jgi:hypothetical protein
MTKERNRKTSDKKEIRKKEKVFADYINCFSLLYSIQLCSDLFLSADAFCSLMKTWTNLIKILREVSNPTKFFYTLKKNLQSLSKRTLKD